MAVLPGRATAPIIMVRLLLLDVQRLYSTTCPGGVSTVPYRSWGNASTPVLTANSTAYLGTGTVADSSATYYSQLPRAQLLGSNLLPTGPVL